MMGQRFHNVSRQYLKTKGALIFIDWYHKLLSPVVQTMDSAIRRINHYPVDKHYQNQLRYPVDSDLSGG